MKSVRIVGSGLIGTSIGLALSRSGVAVEMVDNDLRAQKLAQELVGGVQGLTPELVIFATPTSSLHNSLDREFALNPQAGFIDIGSVKTKPQSLVESSLIPTARFCLTHPMAGRELGGAESAQGDLFIGRTWIVDPTGVDRDVLDLVDQLIGICGATKVEMDVASHDRAVALISHLPQIASSALALQLNGGSAAALEVAGAGLRDTTRIAGSNPELWAEILTSNSDAIRPLLASLINSLQDLERSLDDFDYVKNFIKEGKNGRERIPGKHGGKAREYTYVPIVIDDKPGQLRLIFDECAFLGVNVEDLSIEHSPGQEKGLVTLAMSRNEAERFSEHMATKGWSVHPWRS